MAGKQVVNVEQHGNPKYNPESDDRKYLYTYRVLSLKNLVSPPVRTYITSDGVQDLIESGVEVNVSIPK